MVSILGANSASSDAYEISNSLRFNQGDSPVLSKTPSSSGNQKTMTFSFWIKRSHLDDEFYFFYSAGQDANNRDGIRFYNNSLDLIIQRNDYDYYRLLTTAKFRDISAWYHIVIAIDTTDSTSSNRFKMYVNGSQISDFQTETYPPQNLDLYFNQNIVQYIGRFSTSNSSHYDGYIAEWNFIDGSQKAPTDFGETNSNGVWIPKAYTGAYGTNGFFLEFKQTGTSQNSSGIGADTSGNDNHFAVSNLVASSVVPDTPTLNYATMNPLDAPSNFSSAHGNLRVNGSSSGSGSIGSTIYVNTGKWYVEMRAEDMGNGMSVGIKSDTEGTSWKPTLGESVIYQSDSNKIIDGGSATSYGATYGVGDIIGIKINLDDGEIEFLKNNSSQGNASTSLSSGVYFGIFFLDTSSIDNARAMFNFGQDSTFVGATSAGNNSDANGYGDFKYAVPSGYYALNTKNLAEFG